MALELAEQIWNLDKVLKMEFSQVVDYLIIKKQQKNLEYYYNAKPALDKKMTTR